VILEGIKRREYRGYGSAGIAVTGKSIKGRLQVRRAERKRLARSFYNFLRPFTLV
jgi:glucosamine 6-phosphate synthetase-like amidotransferase/phosphosugar isomerase protein